MHGIAAAGGRRQRYGSGGDAVVAGTPSARLPGPRPICR